MPRPRNARSSSGSVLAVQLERLQSQLWPLPVLAVVVAVAAGLLLVRVDLALDDGLSAGVRSVVFDGDADTARSVLSSITGAIVTATSLTFSLTVVAFQLASSQASPRLLRTFTRDGRVHATLAVFLGTFAYSLTVLRAVRDGSGVEHELVPRLSITLGFLLALASIITLVLFLAHLASQLRIETMLQEADDDAVEAIAVVRHEMDREPGSARAVALPGDPPTVAVPRSGFISGVDRMRLLRVAAEEDLRVVELHRVGAHLVREMPLLQLDRAVDDRVADRLRDAYALDHERTAGQDYLFAVQQIVDVAVRALSPGVNDPTSAVHALGHLSSLLVRLRHLPDSPASLVDDDGVPRLAPARADFADALAAAVTQIRRYGAGDLDAASRLYALLREVVTGTERVAVREAVAAELGLLDGSVEAGDWAEPERARFRALADSVRALLPPAHERVQAPT